MTDGLTDHHSDLPRGDSPITSTVGQRQNKWLRSILVFALLYLFLIGIKLLESGVLGLGDDTAGGLFDNISNPIAALCVGILATVLVQSSSVTTATIVALVSTGQLPIETAVPMVMGANVGTTITSTLVALTHARQSEDFQRALAAATMHDFFNLIAVAILLPLEIATGFLQTTATWLADHLPGGSDATFDSPIESAVEWGAEFFTDTIGFLLPNDTTAHIAFILVGLGVIFITLTYITKSMKTLIEDRIERSVNASLEKSGLVGMGVGMIVTFAVQSSSITTSIIVPLVASGLLLVRNAYPITLGANVGTTVTAFIAALATNSTAAMSIAIVHLLFNMVGIAIIYPWNRIRYVPVILAETLAAIAVTRKWVAVGYTVIVFIMVPFIGILLLS